METIVSIALYFITFFGGFIIDARCKNKVVRRIFIVWLYAFLCFGYMTGSDWRQYELSYEGYHTIFHVGEYGFDILMNFMSTITPDYFLTIGILKCLYLYSLIKLLENYTDRWLSAISLLMPISILFMIIDNPLRFMIALTFVNTGLVYSKKGKNTVAIAIIIAGMIFHTTSLFFVIAPIISKYSNKLFPINRIIILLLYIALLYVSSNVEIINTIKESVLLFAGNYIDMKDYSSYDAQDTEVVYLLGSIIQVSVFALLLITKGCVNKDSDDEKSLYGLAISYAFLSKFFLIVPTGFRLAIPFGYFYAVYIVLLLTKKHIIGYVLSLYLAVLMYKHLYTGYVYIPYSNSIWYIVTQNHLPYNQRCYYNIDAFEKRMHKHFRD